MKANSPTTDLMYAAEELELKSRGGTPFERYDGQIWRSILELIPNYCPPWYRCLTAEYVIGGANFRYPIDDRAYIGMCTIPRPMIMLRWVQQQWPVKDLFDLGYSCFADGENRNFWMFRHDAEFDPEVFFLELTAWNGAEPTLQNGLFAPGITLSNLLLPGALDRR